MRSSSKKPEIGSLGKIGEARLDLVPQLADCRPGIRPIEYNVIVAPAPSTEVEGKIGSIFIPDEAKETLDLAMQVGRVIAQSPLAYDYAKWPADTKPQVGQIVWFARYAGKEFEGADGKTYRILKDKDIGAVIEEPVPDHLAQSAYGRSIYADLKSNALSIPHEGDPDWLKTSAHAAFQPLHETET